MLLMLRVLVPLFARVATFGPPRLPTATTFHEMEAGVAVTWADVIDTSAKALLNNINSKVRRRMQIGRKAMKP